MQTNLPDSDTHRSIGASEPGNALRGRLRWRCMRSGLLELDLVFDRFLARDFDKLSAKGLADLGQLLDFEDPQLWAILSGREECPREQLKGLVDMLRRNRAQP